MTRKTLKLLLVEDNAADAQLMRKMLAGDRGSGLGSRESVQYALTWVETLKEARESIARQSFDAILLDLSLPDSVGLETITAIARDACNVPIVVLTGLDSEEIAVESLRNGAQDYLVKSELHQTWLLRAIQYAIERQQIFDRLRQLNQELQRSNRDLEEFACVASHDLQQPLTSITANAQLFELQYGDRLDPQSRHYLRRILEAVRRMQQLIQDLLAYSQLNTDSGALQATDCNRVVRIVIGHLSDTIERTGAIVESKALPTVTADEVQLIRLFQNLLENALRYRRPNVTPRVQISAMPLNGEWCFSISDNGIGIESKDFSRIFKIFQRLHSQEQYPGTGIGLAICQRIVEGHNGRIWVESELDEGTTFFWTLPKD
ncbi:sensor histidine kinase [Baaleninema sp.]|uniref:sensor histidine kinase n=1 Tax=Baaleninema sp. TaxID=3101197 RepID=UPI003CFDE087